MASNGKRRLGMVKGESLQQITIGGVRFDILTPTQKAEFMVKDFEIIPLQGRKYLYIGNLSRRDLYKATGYDMDSLDFAVPQDWFDLPESRARRAKGDAAVWYYGGKNKLFGGPVWDSEMVVKLKKKINTRLKLRSQRG